MKKIILTLLLIFSFANAQPNMAQIEKIFQFVGAENGYINKEMHTAFWKELQQAGSDEKAKEVAKIMKKNMFSAKAIQLESYKSFLLTYDNKKTTKTKRYKELQTQEIELFEKAMPYKKGSKNYIVAMKAYKERMKISKQHTKSFFKASASHGTMTTNDGRSIKVTRQMLTNIIKNMDDSFKRFDMLFSPNWKK